MSTKMRCLMWVGVAILLFKSLTATVKCPLEYPVCFLDGRVNTTAFKYDFDGILTTIEGPVEICVGGQFESVCDIGWDALDAQSLCQYLHVGSHEAEPLYGVGEPSRRYASRTYNCSESDFSLQLCNYSSVIDPECNNGPHVAGVRCRPTCYDGEVHLRNMQKGAFSYDNGLSTYQGRVDICVNGTYLPFCDLGFDNHDAQVVCSSIYGCNYVGKVAQSFPRFPSTEYFAQDLMCNGSESSVTQCPYNSLTSPECNVGNHSAAVVCREVCREGNVRLINKTSSLDDDMIEITGTVQICVNRQYGYVCADNWDNREAEVACRTLSFVYSAPYYENTASTTVAITGDVPIYSNFMCNGTEEGFSECQLPVIDSSSTCTSIGTVNCTEVIPQCFTDETVFRLENTTTNVLPNVTTVQGRIEVCANFSYSSLCSQYWDQDDAQVFCEYYARLYYYEVDIANITGYPSPPSQYGYSRAGVVPYDVKCNGTEERVEDCVIDKSPESSSDICKDPASSAAGVVCSIPIVRPAETCWEFNFRLCNNTCQLTEGLYLSETISGIIEICINGTYVAICDVGWDDEEAQTLCNYFGYSEPLYRGEALTGCAPAIPIGVEYITGSGITPPTSPRCLSNFSAAGLSCIKVPPSPPIRVLALCSVVVWHSPDVSCDLILGYDVMLYHPRSQHQNVTRRVSSNGNLYIINDEDKLAGSVEEAYVQVRVIQSSGPGEWSKGISLGCGETLNETPATPSIYFELMGKVYLNNSVLSIKEVGEGESALYCRTDKTECCATSPNRFGEFYYPNGVQVPIRRHQHGFYRDRGDKYIRLNRRKGNIKILPSGAYKCEIPDADGVMVKIYITLME